MSILSFIFGIIALIVGGIVVITSIAIISGYGDLSAENEKLKKKLENSKRKKVEDKE